MPFEWTTDIHPSVPTIQKLLEKVDRLHLPARSRRDVESILVRQAARELDYAFPAHAGHGLRTAEIAVAIGQALAMTEEELHQLKLASYLHDIGLLTIPREVTEHSGFLDAEAYRTVQNHARIGASLLEPFTFLRQASALIAHHHERWDGTGYPYGIRGPFIPLGARILAIADAFDAITVTNVCEPRQRDLIALRILRVASGTQFDPELVELCCHCLSQTGRGHMPSHCIASNRFQHYMIDEE
jgi:HD-GYP domain-containing protein (c-di-GMP phosphodiesterase class II)